jgi:glycosyltransferase involved in cell wall biosynthesis
MRFCYINTANIYPHDIHLIDGLRGLGHEVIEINEKSGGFQKYSIIARRYKTTDGKFDAIIVGFTCPHFVPLMRVISTNKIIFNGVSSQYEANVISRGDMGDSRVTCLKVIKWWITDFLSFNLSTKILLESPAQMDFINKTFFIPGGKLKLSWTGVDEKEFFFDPEVKKNPNFTVLFRGRFLPESGIDTVIRAAKLVDGNKIKFLVMGHGHLYALVGKLMEELKPTNLTMITERLPIHDLRRKMLGCHLSLGQLANHPRLDRTLPCKLFESLSLGLPYLTGRNRAALELLTDEENCLTVDPGDANDLAKKITELERDRRTLDRISRAGHELFKNTLTSKKLAEQFLHSCFK